MFICASSTIEDDTQTLNLYRHRHNNNINRGHLDLARVGFEPTRRISVLLLFSLKRFDVNQSLISATQSDRIRSKGGFGGQVELSVIPNVLYY